MGIFKAYDIRGLCPGELDEDLARRIGLATVAYLGAKQLVVGHDMRGTSPGLARALTAGLTAAGCDVISIGEVSTPFLYFAVGHLKTDGGIMITASHNPKQYNGLKFCREDAIPMGFDSGLSEVEKLLDRPAPAGPPGKVSARDLTREYLDHVVSFAEGVKPFKLVVDAGNGMGGKFVPLLFQRLPGTVIPLFFELDGGFPNHEPNPLKPENTEDLRREVVRQGADLGVATDGDADRCAFCDERGEMIASDLVTAFLARPLLAREPGGSVVYDVRSSRAVAEEIVKAGGKPIRNAVGHALIKATMRRHHSVFGGELAGHYYFRDNYYADSGMIALVKMLNALSAAGQPASACFADLRRYHASGEVNFRVTDTQKLIESLAAKFADGEIDYLDGITVNYEHWWFNVRPSNTEPILRLNLEADSPALLREGLDRVQAILGQPA